MSPPSIFFSPSTSHYIIIEGEKISYFREDETARLLEWLRHRAILFPDEHKALDACIPANILSGMNWRRYDPSNRKVPDLDLDALGL